MPADSLRGVQEQAGASAHKGLSLAAARASGNALPHALIALTINGDIEAGKRGKE
jgi:hypothetical protein